ncbi:CRISPR-associated protein Csy4 [Rhodopirellula maiorica SM1]|uniref:CRISPR-associated protein Csy4 n=1 Tax=Rhodopirellula maiorica SM1 TaxID=1265738 RepID=M5S0G2_9BACT|nr:type I-F CRISPR-associated endoribonuclease Cas6/Csy4 [Rhodopirellula maiorica]EMI19654.1 CRISPR-associated protein Csy4 [Rhodopirellula maiorica SM1]
MSVLTSPEVVATHYCEFTCLPDAEISTGFLMGRLMYALHLTMVIATPAEQACPFGVTFPDYRLWASYSHSERSRQEDTQAASGQDDVDLDRLLPIGNRIRLFARSEQELESIEWSKSMVGLDDYVHRTRPRCTPSAIKRFAAFARHQPKASPERLIRRAMKRHGIDEAEARRRYKDYVMDRCRLPWVDMRSESSRHRFRLFIDRVDVQASSDWGFSAYGLSRTVGLPLF